MSPTATLSLEHFLDGGFDLRRQLADHLALEPEELERRLPLATESLATMANNIPNFYCARRRRRQRFQCPHKTIRRR